MWAKRSVAVSVVVGTEWVRGLLVGVGMDLGGG